MIYGKRNAAESQGTGSHARSFNAVGGERAFSRVAQGDRRAHAPKKTPAEEELEKELAALAENGYVDYVATDRKGERTYVLELSRKGADYFREERDSRRRFALRIAVAALCGAASALAGFLLKLLFS